MKNLEGFNDVQAALAAEFDNADMHVVDHAAWINTITINGKWLAFSGDYTISE